MLKKNISATFIAGMFFFSANCMAGPLELATDLFEKGEWNLCRRECRRAILSDTPPVERFQLLEALSGVRAGMEAGTALPFFLAIVQENRDPEVTASASYEAGRLQWQMDRTDDAFGSFAAAFHSTTNKALFLHAACSLFLLMEEDKSLREGQEDLISQINTSRDQWYGALFAQCGRPDPKAGAQDSPGWIIGFYRTQISPAIGARCTLQPSCSEYFLQARNKHGLLAYPMIADRFFREPEVNKLAEVPVIMPDGRILFRDPVEYHDFWMSP